MKHKIVLFGAGYYGQNTLRKLWEDFEIIGFADNNPKIKNKSISDIPVMGIEELKEIAGEADIVICVRNYEPIVKQFMELGISDYYIMLDGFLYHTSRDETMMPVELSHYPYYRKNDKRPSILFVQNAACIRTLKIAETMKRHGYIVNLLYTFAPPSDDNVGEFQMFDNVWGFSSAAGISDFVCNGEFDIIHSSNEPDLLTCLLLRTKKKIVFDTHDMESLRRDIPIETLALEYIANTDADGNMYTSKGVLEIANKKYEIFKKKSFSLENTVLEQIAVTEQHEKLSVKDNRIHCVYEGGVVGNDPNHHRYFQDIWMKIVECGIHIHFYSQSDAGYCWQLDGMSEYLHYEGRMGSKALINEMTRYDCGLAIFNVNHQNREFLETGTANKVYEYLNAGLPVVVGDIDSYVAFVEKYKVGKKLDLSGDIWSQFKSICNIKIEKDFLKNNKLTMHDKSDDIDVFYHSVMQQSKQIGASALQ